MTFEEKYQKAGFDYYLSVVIRKITNAFLSYPEFIFLGKIIVGFFILMILFFLFKKSFGF